MIEPFFWMFKAEGFKIHVLKLFFCVLISVILLLIYDLVSHDLIKLSIELHFILAVLCIVSMLLLLLTILGYFWTLTDNTVCRNTDVIAKNLYNGKVKTIDIITLPQWNIIKFIWRGISSIVATVILFIPFVLLADSFIVAIDKAISFWQFSGASEVFFVRIVAIIIWLFVPGLLWNYARRDSIFALLNIFKVGYLIESYPARYIMRSIQLMLVSFVHIFILYFFVNTFCIASNADILSFFTSFSFSVSMMSFILFSGVIGIYFLFVYSYLIGTVAPANENL